MTAALTVRGGVEVFVADDLEVTYEISGPPDAPVVVVLGGISAGCHVAATDADRSPGWWDRLAGAGRVIDNRRYRVLGIDWGTRCATSHEHARALRRLLVGLGIARAHAIVGSSYGGMVGLAFAEQYPEAVRHVVAISAPAASHPFATGFRSLQRRVLRLGVDHGCEREALGVARGIGMLTYRTAAEFEQRFGGARDGTAGGTTFPVEDYLDARGRAFAEYYDATTIERLSRAIDLHRVDPGAIRVPVTVVASTTDWLVPLAQLSDLAARLAGPSRLVTIDSRYGHDAFLKEHEALAPVLAEVLS